MKKILLIIVLIMAIFQMVVLATAITIGDEATDRATEYAPGTTGRTVISMSNPATTAGTITSIEIYPHTTTSDPMYNTQIGIFYEVSADHFTTRADIHLGTVTPKAGKQTFTEDSGSNPISMSIEIGDCIGIFFTHGKLEADIVGGESYYLTVADNIPCTNVEFTKIDYSTRHFSFQGLGAEAVGGNAIMMGTNF